jgi:hypothetical protein
MFNAKGNPHPSNVRAVQYEKARRNSNRGTACLIGSILKLVDARIKTERMRKTPLWVSASSG